VTTVRGPVTGGVRGWAFSASVRPLSEVGYVEEEYLLTGDATEYSHAAGTEYTIDGRWTAVPRDTLPFATRFLVRRPVDPDRFDGVVIVGWNNVSRGYEFTGGPMDEVVASGSAFVGASVQRVGLHGLPIPGDHPAGLVTWDAERYGELSIPHDDASFDIYTQIARVVGPDRETDGNDPMAGLPVEHLVAFGASQSANRLGTYHNAIQPLSGCFDGFLLGVYSGGGTRVDALGPGPSLPQLPPEARELVNLLPFGSHRLRDDLDAKVIVLNSETEAPWYVPVRQPDSDTFRLWEVTGAAHTGLGNRTEADAQAVRDFGRSAPLPSSVPSQANPNVLSFQPVTEAAVHHLRRWVVDDVAPPGQDLIEFAGEPPRAVRDDDGNALGGIRIPGFAVPTATHVGESPDGVPDLTGSTTPFTDARLRELYPNRSVYLARYEAAVQEGVARGFLLERHRAELLNALGGSGPIS
jgi:hypothetical protein